MWVRQGWWAFNLSSMWLKTSWASLKMKQREAVREEGLEKLLSTSTFLGDWFIASVPHGNTKEGYTLFWFRFCFDLFCFKVIKERCFQNWHPILDHPIAAQRYHKMVTHWEHMTGRLSFKVKVLDTQLCQLFETPWTLVHQAPLSMEFFRQEYWSGLLFLSPEARETLS